MTQMEIKDEIKVRKLVIKKLDTAIKALDKIAAHKREKQKARLDQLMEYKSYDEAQDAYGCGIITEKEFDDICDLLEHNEKAVEAPCYEESAAKILNSLRAEMYSDIRSLEFELLPVEERNRILDENLRILREKDMTN